MGVSGDIRWKELLKRQAAWDAAEGGGWFLKAAGRESGWVNSKGSGPWEAPSYLAQGLSVQDGDLAAGGKG